MHKSVNIASATQRLSLPDRGGALLIQNCKNRYEQCANRKKVSVSETNPNQHGYSGLSG